MTKIMTNPKRNSEKNTHRAFRWTVRILSAIRWMPFGRGLARLAFRKRVPSTHRTELFGLDFRNPVGLAANIDSEGVLCGSLSDFGFSFIEIGPLSYIRQEHGADVGSYVGVKKAVEHLIREKPDCIVSGNITRNPQSRGADALKDYENAFALLYDFVDMTVIYPRYPSADDEADSDVTDIPDIIDRILTMRLYYDRNKPVLLRLSPELSRSQVDEIIACCLSSGIDGVVAGGTGGNTDDESALLAENLDFISYIREKSGGLLPIIGVGGVMNGRDAAAMMAAGASLVEVYSGFFRKGPAVVRKIVNGLPATAPADIRDNAPKSTPAQPQSEVQDNPPADIPDNVPADDVPEMKK